MSQLVCSSPPQPSLLLSFLLLLSCWAFVVFSIWTFEGSYPHSQCSPASHTISLLSLNLQVISSLSNRTSPTFEMEVKQVTEVTTACMECVGKSELVLALVWNWWSSSVPSTFSCSLRFIASALGIICWSGSFIDQCQALCFIWLLWDQHILIKQGTPCTCCNSAWGNPTLAQTPQP